MEIWCRQNNSCPNCRTKNVISDCSYQRLNVQPPLSPVSFINHSPFYHILDASGAEITPSTAPNSVGNNFENNFENDIYINHINNINNINNINAYINNMTIDRANYDYNYNYNTNTNTNTNTIINSIDNN